MMKWKKELKQLFVTVVISLVFVFLNTSNLVLAGNTLVGTNAGISITTGNNNTFVGEGSGLSSTTGSYNAFMGFKPGFFNTSGNNNTFLGAVSGFKNTTGRFNTFTGMYSGFINNTGIYNTFMGALSGYSNFDGSRNTCLGMFSGFSNATGDGNVFLGYQAGYNETGSNKLYIASSSVSPPLIYGDFSTGKVGLGTTSPAAKLEVNGDALFHNTVDEDTSVDIRSGAADAFAALRLLNSSGTVNGILGYDEENDTVHLVHDSTFLPSMKGIIIDNNGKVSIGSGGGQFSALLSINNLSGVDPLIIGPGPGIPLLILKNDGNLGIGTANPLGKVDINGSIYQRGDVLSADYVFDSDYKLESIEEHAEFMWKNKHLKSIPAAKVDENGREVVEVGTHRKGIVEELEKAHIYIEQLKNKNETIKEYNQALEVRLAKLEARFDEE